MQTRILRHLFLAAAAILTLCFLVMPNARGQSVPPGITYVTTAEYWQQSLSTALTGGTAANVTLNPCPNGLDTTTGMYDVYILDGTSSEAVLVTGGSSTSCPSSGTITFTPFYSHTSYTIESASSGIQETINSACGVSAIHPYYNSQCNVTIPANGPYISGSQWSINNYNVYGTIFFHSNQSILDGPGVSLNCTGRGPCLQIGDLTNANDYTNNTVRGISFRSPTNFSSNSAYAGVVISNTSVASGHGTTTTATPHNFRPGDIVTTLFTDNPVYWGDAVVTDCGSGTTPATCTSSSTTFRYTHSGTYASQPTPGVVALAYEAVLDDANATHFIDIQYDLGGEVGNFNNFFDLWDDENAEIDHFNNNAISLNHSATWMGSFVFSGGAYNITTHQLAPVITLRASSITANFSSGVTDFNSNGLYIDNTVIQATGLWDVYSANTTGNYQGATIKDMYSGSNSGLNTVSPKRTPFPGTGGAGLIAGYSSGAAVFKVAGNGGVSGYFATGGSGSTPFSYFVVANDTTSGTQTSPMQVLNWESTGSDSPVVLWPRVANGTDGITYDVIRVTTPVGPSNPSLAYPYSGGCNGGSGGICGYVAKGLSQATACSGGLVCSYTDGPQPTSTSAYTIKEGNYVGALNFWPGSIVAVFQSVNVDVEAGNVVGVGLSGNPIQIPQYCSGYGVASSGGYSSCLASKTSFNNAVPNQTATILTDGANSGGSYSRSKGRLNFGTSPFDTTITPHHFITLIDSQPALTRATPTYRPLASINDTWIGTDVPSGGAAASAGQLAFGSPTYISSYISNTGDNASFLTRLSGTGLALATHLNQSATGKFAGKCTMSSATTCTISISASYTSSPGCVVTVQGTSAIAGACSVSGTTVTITAASSNSATWAAMLFGNPN